MSNIVLTATVGDNSDLWKIASDFYLKDGDVVADVTYGKGVFWKKQDAQRFTLKATDLMQGVDFSNLPYEAESIDGLVLDPPYMHGGATVKKSINDCYRNQNTSHQSVIRLYAGGILEAHRVVKRGGLVFIKCQDEIESGKQKFSHMELITLCEMLGFKSRDLFVLVQSGVPTMRVEYQKTARKNHSYLLVMERGT